MASNQPRITSHQIILHGNLAATGVGEALIGRLTPSPLQFRSMTQKRLPANPFAGDDGVIVLAHRGFRGRYPENTMLAFQKAADLGVDGLEMDIHSTSDGALVVSHDATVNRTTNGSGPIKKPLVLVHKLNSAIE